MNANHAIIAISAAINSQGALMLEIYVSDYVATMGNMVCKWCKWHIISMGSCKTAVTPEC